jgi:uncharacterized protein YciI
MFLIRLTYPDPAATWALREKHIAWGNTHSAAGRMLLSGPFVPRTGGVIIADVGSREELDAMLREDPYAAVGTTYDIMEFTALNGSLLDTVSSSRPVQT